MRSQLPVLAVLVVGCGSSTPPPATTTTTTTTNTAAPAASPIASATAEPPPKEPEGPALVIANLAVTVKKQGEQRTLDLSWDVTRNRELPANTVIFVHSTCKVGYNNKYEDSSVGGVDGVPEKTTRPFKTSAYGFAPLPFDATYCTFAFAFGAKGSKDETKLASFCWKSGSVTDGPCS
jgi:hypothetical protein